MKRTLFILSAILIVLISISIVFANRNVNIEKNIAQFNSYYEKYLDKQFFGTDVATLIGKVIDNNEKCNIKKDENGKYLLDDKYSIEIYIKLYGSNKYYDSETINKVGIAKFISNFNTISFICKNIKYHDSTKRVSEIYIEEFLE